MTAPEPIDLRKKVDVIFDARINALNDDMIALAEAEGGQHDAVLRYYILRLEAEAENMRSARALIA